MMVRPDGWAVKSSGAAHWYTRLRRVYAAICGGPTSTAGLLRPPRDGDKHCKRCDRLRDAAAQSLERMKADPSRSVDFF